MNVTVFGATGAIGSLTVAELLERGHTVTAYARNRAKVPSTWGDRVRVVIGEMSDANAIDSAVAGADAVVSALGPSLDRKATGLPLVEGTRQILEAMKRHGVRRYVGNGTPSVLDQRDRPNWQTKVSTFMAETFLRRAYDELVGMSEIVMSSGLDWTIVRFLAPKDGPRQGTGATGVLRPRQPRLQRHQSRHRRVHRGPGRRRALRQRRTRHQQLRPHRRRQDVHGTPTQVAALRNVAPGRSERPTEALAPVLAVSCCGLMGLRPTRADLGT